MDMPVLYPELPPNFWLPGAEKDVDQYRRENLIPGNIGQAELLDYGSFVVALAVLGAPETGRVSMMPNKYDVQEVYDAGFGISPKTIRNRGGLRNLQYGLGFYPDGYTPTEDELMERFEWLASFAYPAGNDGVAPRDITEVIKWGAARDLTPGYNRVYKILNGNTTKLRQLFDVEHYDTHKRVTHAHLFNLGERILKTFGGPISTAELDRLYSDEFPSGAYHAIRQKFGSYANFWLEFGYVPDASGLSKKTILDLGVRWAIDNRQTGIDKATIETLSKHDRFPSPLPINNKFGGIENYRDEVRKGFKEYVVLRTELLQKSVSPEVCEILFRTFETGNYYAYKTRANLLTLVKLSDNSQEAAFIRLLMRHGFDQERDEVFAAESATLERCFVKLGLNRDERRYIYGLMPRVNAYEALTGFRGYLTDRPSSGQ